MSNKSSFERLDIFGVAVALNFAGSVRSKSKHGTFFTVIFVIFLIWAIIYSASQLIARKDPKTNTYDIFKEDPAEMTISKRTLPFAVGLKHSTDMGFDHFVNESIYQIKVYQVTLQAVDNGDGTFSQTREALPLDIEPCTPGSFGELSSSFKNLPLHLLYCLKAQQTYVKDITIKGNTGSAFFQGIKVSIKKCDPITFNDGCATDEEINKTLTAAYFQVYYPQLAINPTDSTHPDMKFRQDTITMVSPSYYKSGQITLGHVTVSSDYGWLVEEMHSENYIQVNSLSEDLDLRASQSGYLYDLLIFVDQLERNYERTYIKLQDILAQVQGLATAAIIVILIIINPYSQVKFHESLINELFDVKMMRKKGSKNEVSKNSEKFSEPPKIQIQIPSSDLSPQVPIIITETQNIPKSVVNSPEINKELDEQQIPPPSSTRNLLSLKTPNPNSNPDSTTVGDSNNRAIKNGGLTQLCTIQEKLTEEEGQGPGKKKTFMSRLTGNAQKAQKVENKDLTDMEEDIPNFISFHSDNSFMKEIKEDEKVLDKKKDIHKANDDPAVKENQDEIQQEVLSPKSGNVETDQIIPKLPKRKETLSRPQYESKKIHISFWEYLSSLVGNSGTLKEKMGLLNKGVDNIEERLDIFNILKKFREIDKLKALLLEHDQLVLFNAMPKPEIKLEDHLLMNEVSRRLIKSTTFVEGHEKDKHKVMRSHQNLVEKPIKSKIDRKLLEIFEDSWAP